MQAYNKKIKQNKKKNKIYSSKRKMGTSTFNVGAKVCTERNKGQMPNQIKKVVLLG